MEEGWGRDAWRRYTYLEGDRRRHLKVSKGTLVGTRILNAKNLEYDLLYLPFKKLSA